MRKLWGGAFGEESLPAVEAYGQSIASDLTFWREDVEGSIAHARMLGASGIIPEPDAATLIGGLEQILADGPERLPTDVEDIHTAVESRLREIVGPVAGKLHTARSRNDQVATAARLHLRRRLSGIEAQIKGLQRELLAHGEANVETLLPGVTHQQHAQPTTVAFHFCAYAFAFQRHGWRCQRAREIIQTSPLGSAALAGTPFPVDREQTASELGFTAPSANALDATSDRSYVLDSVHVCNLIMLDLSRLAQEIVNWAGPEYGFIKLADSVTTGSSIMPQKRNPDMAELIRGRAGRTLGAYTSLSVMMKGLVMGYNRDTQEDKPALFEALRTVEDALEVMILMLQRLQWQPDRMAAAIRGDFSTATDLADALAEGGMPFREAHEVVGQVVRYCLDSQKGLEDLSLDEARSICAEVTAEILDRLCPIRSLRARTSLGGTAPSSVLAQIERLKTLIADELFMTVQ